MTAVKFALLTVLGLALAVLGVWNLRARLWDDAVPAGPDEDAEPRTRWGRNLARINGALMLIVGLAMAAFGAVTLYSMRVAT